MRIALIGYGKMGKIIERIAISRGHSITGKSSSKKPISAIDFSKVDVAIEFTAPGLAVNHIKHCIDYKTPVVVGTTAWSDHLLEVKDYVTKNKGSLLHASNFSVGVNIFFDLNRRLARLMAPNQEYTGHIEETHHLQKLDAPSGTAVSLANDVILENENLSSWVHEENTVPDTQSGQLGVTSFREDGVPGTHSVTYQSTIDTIKMTHTAHSREGFALGAVIAAEWLLHKKGVFTMQDVIKL
ncbi:MAG: 4-hydroxy-tetrahydrodipicolinate reductase [Crocinitomicaceae bacterium]|nr:4-hydroxy-tetrahydrodipicolinate reductase [Crocinitomicaceae bacterium]